MDYDKSTIPAVYDQARGLAPEVLQRWLDLVARDARPAQGSLIVDVGCGTGRFCEPLAERFAARVMGVDPSEQMLEVARKKTSSGRVEFRRASADALPLDPASADVVFLSMVFHHLPDAGAGGCGSSGACFGPAVMSACARSPATEMFRTGISFRRWGGLADASRGRGCVCRRRVRAGRA